MDTNVFRRRGDQKLFRKISSPPFAKMATQQPYRSISVPLRLLNITILFMTVSSAVADSGAACPDRCSCTVLNSYVSSTSVKCSYLGLSDMPAMLHETTVHTLDLSNNDIRILRNDSFSNYSTLSTLILSNNEVEEIQLNAFAGLLMMRVLDLRYNKLNSFNPKIISANTVLEKVSLQGNAIAYLPSNSPILISASVSFLDLSECSLTSVHPITFSGLPNLYSLDLSSNLLRTISVNAFEKLPKLNILKLNNNRWTCNCDTLELMQWLTLRRQQAPAHKPVKCLEGQKYRKFWTMAGGSQPCSPTATTEALVGREGELTTGMTVDFPHVSVGIPQSPNPIVDKTSPWVEERATTSKTEIRTVPESESGGSGSILSWNGTTLTVCVILPITLSCAVFLSLVATHYFTKRYTFRSSQREIQETGNHNAGFFSRVPLLNPQLTAEQTKQYAEYANKGSYRVGGTEYHVYERIE